MADPLRAEDIYEDPALAPTPSEPPILPGTPPLFGELPPARSRLNSTAGSLGSSVGSAVRRVRRLPSHLKVVGGRNLESQNVETDTGTLDDMKDAAHEHLQDWRDSSRRMIHQARRHVHDLRQEYPVHTILAFGAAGFLIGATVRIWRSK